MPRGQAWKPKTGLMQVYEACLSQKALRPYPGVRCTASHGCNQDARFCRLNDINQGMQGLWLGFPQGDEGSRT